MENINNKKILCVFTNQSELINDLNNVLKYYYKNISSDIFVYNDTQIQTKYYIVSTINNIKDTPQNIKNSILLHRKKQTNTIFTLNGLNFLLSDLSANEEINWDDYKNTLILTTNENKLKIVYLNYIGKIDKQQISN